MADQHNPTVQLTSAELAAEIIRRRANRESFAAIGRAVGRSPQRCHQIWSKAIRELPVENLAEYRHQELELVERALRDLIRKAENPQVTPRSSAEVWNTVRGWAEHRAKLLGLYAPTRRETTIITSDAIDQEIQRLQRELEESARAAGVEVPEEV